MREGWKNFLLLISFYYFRMSVLIRRNFSPSVSKKNLFLKPFAYSRFSFCPGSNLKENKEHNFLWKSSLNRFCEKSREKLWRKLIALQMRESCGRVFEDENLAVEFLCVKIGEGQLIGIAVCAHMNKFIFTQKIFFIKALETLTTTSFRAFIIEWEKKYLGVMKIIMVWMC